MSIMKNNILDKNDYKTLAFLNNQRKNRKLFIFCSVFSILIGMTVILVCLKVYRERFLWEGLYFISIGIALFYLNNQFIKMAILLEKLLNLLQKSQN